MSHPSTTVHKFGGAALADLSAFRHAAEIIASRGGARPVIVVSAMRGVTDALNTAASSSAPKARATLATLESRHRAVARGLAANAAHGAQLTAVIHTAFAELIRLCTRRRKGLLDAQHLDFVISRGEVLAASLMVAALGQRALNAVAIDARCPSAR